MSELRLIWVDDDGPRRFAYEEFRIRQAGWSLRWGLDLRSAAEDMAETRFHALILDQKLPYVGLEGAVGHWGGCLFLRWLRGAGLPDGLTLSPVAPSRDLFQLSPLESNRDIPAILVSVYHRLDILEQTRAASPRDETIALIAKPVKIDLLLEFLEEIRAELE